jgi:hypothetical protein
MLSLFSLTYLAALSSVGVYGLPVCLDVAGADVETSGSCNDLRQCRTLWDILSSCCVTITLCSWIVVHPDIDKKGSVLLRKFMGAAEAALAPEWTVAWILYQRFSARNVLNRVNGALLHLLKGLRC